MAESAAETLERAFATRCGAGESSQRPRVGVFGDGLPEALITAAGGEPVEIKAPPADDALAAAPRQVAAVIEDFVDPFTARFLHRYAAGWYRDLAALVFARDDVAALTAYQYASELRRQGLVPRDGPRLLLWNLVHDRSDAVHEFNMVQAERLLAGLSALTGTVADEEWLAMALAAEEVRLAAVDRMQAAFGCGRQSFVWRNAGRWLPAERHAALLDAGLGEAAPRPEGPRIGLVGTAVIDPDLHAMLEGVGPVAADLQPYGTVWPGCHAGGTDLDGLIRSIAGFPLHLRAAPPTRFRAALLDGLGGCDLVVSQVVPSDDGFGWEVPALRQALAARGVPLVDLGFRPFRPQPDWLAAARRRIVEALELAA